MVLPTALAYELDLRARSDGSPGAQVIIAVAVHELRDPDLDIASRDLWRCWVDALDFYLADPQPDVGIGIVTGEILPIE